MKIVQFCFVALTFGLYINTQVALANPSFDPDKSQYEKQLEAENNKVLFEENKGQVKDQHWRPRADVLFYGQSEGMNFFIRNNGISYQLSEVDSWKEENETNLHEEVEDETRMVPDQITSYRVDVNWVNVQTPKIATHGEQSSYNNYYNVPDGMAPALFVKQFERVVLEGLWPGVDMEFYSRNGYLESDWIVQRAEDYKQIAFEVKGAELRIEKNKLIMKTPLGEITEGALKTYQNDRLIQSRWELEGNVVRLVIDSYDPNLPLRIDPPVRIWGTYYGGSSVDLGRSCSVDNNGYVYLAGSTQSTNSIATSGTHQATFGGSQDAFLAKFDIDGVRQWGTYYGGSSTESGVSCAVDGSGDVYLTGMAQSINNISTFGAHQTSHGGATAGDWDAYLVKFNSNGIRLWGTYFGGNDSDVGFFCDIDLSGNVYLAGWTQSTNNIATAGAHQETYGGGLSDAFLVKFNSNGVRQWGTYYGGSGYGGGYSCAVDGNGDVYLAGYTTSTNNITTAGAHQQTHGGGTRDAVLVKFNGNGVRQWGTYYGGGNLERGWSCTVDGSGNVYMAGNTESTNNIATTGAHQETFGGGEVDAFLVKFNSVGVLQWGTYYGGNGEDWGYSCIVDGSENVYLTGYTASTNDIATIGAHQDTYGGGEADAFLVKFNSNGIRQWGTYYGGNGEDSGYSCAVDAGGRTYLTGYTTSTNNIATTGAHQDAYGGGNEDALLVRFYEDCIFTLYSGASTDSQVPCVNMQITDITYIGNAASCASVNGLPPGVTYSIDGDTLTISGAPSVVDTFTYNIEFNSCCDSLSITGTITVNPSIPITLTSASSTTDQTVCSNEPITNITYTTSEATSATFTGLPTGVSGNLASGDITISGSPTTIGTFNYTISLTGGCGVVEEFGTITVNPLPSISASNDGPVCLGDDVNFTSMGGTSYSWTGPSGFNSVNQNFIISSVDPSEEGTYEVTVTDTNGCSATAQTTFTINLGPDLAVSSENVTCNGEDDGEASVTATGTGPFSFSWNPGGMLGSQVTGLSADTYTVTVTDGNGCTSIETVTITEPSAIDLSFTTNETDCNVDNGGATVTATGGSGGFTYEWTPGNETTSDIANVAAGEYQVTVTDVSGCSASGSVTINYANAPTLSVDQVNHLTCHGAGDGSATISASGGTAPYTYSWSPSVGNGATAENLSAGTYTVTVTDDDDCPASIEVTINEPATIEIDGEATEANCGNFDGTIDLSVSGGTGSYSYSWTPTGLNGDTINNLSPGNYEVTVTDDNGCEKIANFTIGLTGEIPISVDPQVLTIEAGENTQLEVFVGSGVTNETYTWSPEEGLSCINCPDPIASPSETTTYTVTVTTNDGCSSSGTVLVIVEQPCTEVFVPTIFSPNGDNLNDLLCWEGSCISALDFSIFNRWGEVVFKTNDPAECWDGTYNGEPLNTGVFVFKAIIITDDGDKIEKSGNLTLMK